MTLKEKQLEFIIYCIENTAERLERYSANVYNKLKELGAIDGYINAFYDTLHTQGKAYIVDSLLEYIYHRDTNCGLLGRAVVPKSTICPFLLINK